MKKWSSSRHKNRKKSSLATPYSTTNWHRLKTTKVTHSNASGLKRLFSATKLAVLLELRATTLLKRDSLTIQCAVTSTEDSYQGLFNDVLKLSLKPINSSSILSLLFIIIKLCYVRQATMVTTTTPARTSLILLSKLPDKGTTLCLKRS